MAFCLGFNGKVIKNKFQLSAMTFFSFIHSLKEQFLRELLPLSMLSKIFISWNSKNLPLVFVSVSILDHVSAYQQSEVKPNVTDWSTEEALEGISVWQLSLPSCPAISKPNQVIPLVAILQSPLWWTAEEPGFHLHRFIFPSLQLKERSAKQDLKSVAQNKAARSHEGNWRNCKGVSNEWNSNERIW